MRDLRRFQDLPVTLHEVLCVNVYRNVLVFFTNAEKSETVREYEVSSDNDSGPIYWHVFVVNNKTLETKFSSVACGWEASYIVRSCARHRWNTQPGLHVIIRTDLPQT